MTYTPSTQISPSIYKTNFDGLYYISIKKHQDDRGFYSEITRIPQLNQILEKPFEIKQVNHSFSLPKVIRGIHAENWNKLVTVTSGSAICNLVDLRPDSDTFGQYQTFHLGPDYLYGCLFISKGIGNSMYIPDEKTDYIYFVDALYQDRDQANDKSINLFDPDINISWPVPKDQMIISQRDQNCANLRQLFPEKF